MKKNVLKSLACLMLICMAWSCSSESETVMSNQETTARDFREKSGESIWDGEIGIVDEDGNFVITANQAVLYNEFAGMLEQKGNFTKLSSLNIQSRIADNDPSETGYFLIASGVDEDNMATSIGVMLTNMSGFFYLGTPSPEGDPLDVSCRGCGMGCFLKFYIIGKARVPYCDSAGCGPICEKQE